MPLQPLLGMPRAEVAYTLLDSGVENRSAGLSMCAAWCHRRRGLAFLSVCCMFLGALTEGMIQDSGFEGGVPGYVPFRKMSIRDLLLLDQSGF